MIQPIPHTELIHLQFWSDIKLPDVALGLSP
jgi:hypothetical protein